VNKNNPPMLECGSSPQNYNTFSKEELSLKIMTA